MAASSFILASDVVSTFFGKRAWPGCPSKKQDWGYPESMIHYIAKNPSSAEFYQKMIQSCKYFFEKNPVLVVSKLEEYNFGCDICLNKSDECKKNKGKCCVKIDIAKLSSKIWLRDELNVVWGTENFTSVLCSKLYQCEINCLEIGNKVVMFDDLQLLTSTAKDIFLWCKKITFNNGKPVMLDKILESSPFVTEFFFEFYDDSTVNASMKSILKLKNLGKVEYFCLINLPESLSAEVISEFLKKFGHVKIRFHFNEDISEDYKNQLDGLIDEIVESEIPNRIVEYDGQDEGKLETMESRCNF